MLRGLLSLRVVVGCMILAVIGLIALQWYLLDQAMQLKEQAFRRNVLAALGTTVSRLEAGETYRIILGASMSMHMSTKGDSTGNPVPPTIMKPIGGNMPLRFEGNKLIYSVQSPQRIRIQRFDAPHDRDTTLVDTFKVAGTYAVLIPQDKPPSVSEFFRFTTDSARFVIGTGAHMEVAFNVDEKSRKELISTALDRLFVSERQPVEQRIKGATLDSLLTQAFTEAGITLKFVRGIEEKSDTSGMKLVSPAGYDKDLKASDLRAVLFPADIMSPKSDLVVYFPDTRTYVYWQVGPLFGASAFLILGVLAVFTYAIRTIILQRRMAALMGDFVNNMTHEFKTPISTVALAAEAIARPEVRGRGDKIAQYNAIIMDENARMRTNVEKILQMATLEQQEYELNLEPVDVNAFLQEMTVGAALQAEHRGGRLKLQLSATDAFVQADRTHLVNVVNNLLDNAIKYSGDNPCIVVGTTSADSRITIRVTDNGIGIPAEYLGKVFDKFFRVPTGNRHDVKGFGLGLSYVKMMAEAMGGTVGIQSEPGAGTTVEVSFPAAKGGKA